MHGKNLIESFVLFFIITLVQPSFAQTSSTKNDGCEAKILLLPQVSRNVIVSAPTDDASRDAIAESQFRIARYIQAHPRLPVFSEQAVEDLRDSELTGALEEVSKRSKSLFPKGIPSSFDTLTDEQKEHLYFVGADGVMLLTGRIPTIRKIVPNEATQNLIINQVQRAMIDKNSNEVVTGEIVTKQSMPYKLLTTGREQYALEEIKKFFAAFPNEKSAILIFGRSHDFRRHESIFPGRCIETPEF